MLTIINTGININNDHIINPKKLGIGISFSSAIDLTIKLGALPMYVIAPIKTAPKEIAIKVSGISCMRNLQSLCFLVLQILQY